MFRKLWSLLISQSDSDSYKAKLAILELARLVKESSGPITVTGINIDETIEGMIEAAERALAVIFLRNLVGEMTSPSKEILTLLTQLENYFADEIARLDQ